MKNTKINAKALPKAFGLIFFLLTVLVVGCKKETVELETVEKQSAAVAEERVPPTTGWASVTGFRNASTQVQTAIVSAVSGANGQSSGLSSTYSGAPYFTDCYDNDGTRLSQAIAVYNNWYTANPPPNFCSTPSVPASVITNMKNKLSQVINNKSGYTNTSDQNHLVSQITAKYNAWKCANNATFSVPTTDNQILSFLSIRKQCLEWACSIASNAGGTPLSYSGPAQAESNYRPGMGLYRTNSSHAMIIFDIFWTVTKNAQGQIISIKATSFKVAESNWVNPVTFNRPGGQIPWSRTIKTTRTETISGNKVVSFG